MPLREVGDQKKSKIKTKIPVPKSEGQNCRGLGTRMEEGFCSYKRKGAQWGAKEEEGIMRHHESMCKEEWGQNSIRTPAYQQAERRRGGDINRGFTQFLSERKGQITFFLIKRKGGPGKKKTTTKVPRQV